MRQLRRILGQLEVLGYLRIKKQTFVSLTAAQEALGLPLPYRNDPVQAPDLLTLLVDGAEACSFEYPSRPVARASADVRDKPAQDKPRPGIASTVPQGENVQGEPRTKPVEIPPDKMTDDPLRSAFLTRKVEGDPEEQPRPPLDVGAGAENIVAAQNNTAAPVESDAWAVLNAAYDTHYRRVYRSSPTSKLIAVQNKQDLARMLEELGAVLEKQLRERGADLAALPKKPIELLADEALRTWFDSPGSSNFLRRVSHRMKELAQDLPYRVRKAIATLLERHAPKPEPRKGLSPVVDVGRHVARDKPRSMHLPMPSFPPMLTMAERPSTRDADDASFLRDMRRILEGLSARPDLREFGTDVPFASDLAALARERCMNAAQVSAVLDGLAREAARSAIMTPQAKKNALFAAAIRLFGETNSLVHGGAT